MSKNKQYFQSKLSRDDSYSNHLTTVVNLITGHIDHRARPFAILAATIAVTAVLLFPTPGMAASTHQTTPLPPTLVITNTIQPSSDTGLFNIKQNGTLVGANFGNGDATGAIILPSTGTYTVSVEAAPGNSLTQYITTILCKDTNNIVLFNQQGTEANINVATEAQVMCEVSHIRRPGFEATLNDVLIDDADVDSEPGTSPGDTIRLDAIITKTAGISATDVVFSVPIDPNTKIVTNTATTSQGTITVGSSANDTTVIVNIGQVVDSTPIEISFQVMVNSPLPSSVDTVDFQGIITSTNGIQTLTDDPSIPAIQDPTQVSVTAKPLLSVTNEDILLIDSDSDNEISPGDQVFYRITIINIGNGAAMNLELEGLIDPNTILILSTLNASQGSIGNTPTAAGTEIKLSAGILNGGGARAVLEYQVLVKADTTATSISSQFEASADEPSDPSQRFSVLSDDPATTVSGDATTAAWTISLATDGLFLPYISVQNSIQ